jgi:hypothetical protein
LDRIGLHTMHRVGVKDVLTSDLHCVACIDAIPERRTGEPASGSRSSDVKKEEADLSGEIRLFFAGPGRTGG